MKILILANNDIGLYRFRKELIEKLLNMGNDVFISLPYGDLVQPLIDLGCKFFNTPIDRRGINPIIDIKLLLKYRKLMKQINPDIVITYTIKPNIYGGLSAMQTRKRYAVNITGLGTAFENKGLLRAFVIELYKIALRKAETVFVENSSIKSTIISNRICSPQNIYVLNGAGVNTKEYSYTEYPKNEKFHFLFIGRVMKEKGIEELLEATKRLVEDGRKVFLDVVGPCEENYVKKLEKAAGEGWLAYYGYQKDVKQFIDNCDCFVLPSYHEGMANTNLECASSGRPIITSHIPGCMEAVIEGETGFLCEPRNCDSLYHVMNTMLSLTIEKRKSMGINGREHMKKTFEKSLVVDKTINALLAE